MRNSIARDSEVVSLDVFDGSEDNEPGSTIISGENEEDAAAAQRGASPLSGWVDENEAIDSAKSALIVTIGMKNRQSKFRV